MEALKTETELKALPNQVVDKRLCEMRGVLCELPVKVDADILPMALEERARFDDLVQFVEGDFTWRTIDAAGQYMMAIERVLEYALVPWVLGRASLEASARSAWLSETKVTKHERLERNLLLQLSEMPSVDGQKNREFPISDAREMLLSLARKEGIRLSKKRMQDVIPGKTKMVQDALGMGNWYENFSAIIHNNSHATRAVTVKVPENLDPRANALIPIVVWAYSVAVWRFFRNRDLPCDQLTDALTKYGERLGFPTYFWQSQPQPQR